MWSLWRRLVSEMYEQSSERETNANSALQQYSQQPGTGMCEAWQRRMALALVRGKTARQGAATWTTLPRSQPCIGLFPPASKSRCRPRLAQIPHPASVHAK
jgi:hypothetical protein